MKKKIEFGLFNKQIGSVFNGFFKYQKFFSIIAKMMEDFQLLFK